MTGHPTCSTAVRWSAAAIVAGALALGGASAWAQAGRGAPTGHAGPTDHAGHTGHTGPASQPGSEPGGGAGGAAPSPATSPAAGAVRGDGEVVAVDARQGRVTLRHGPTAQWQMGAMTMVFHAEPSLLDGLAPGMRVRFRAQRIDGRFVIVGIETPR